MKPSIHSFTPYILPVVGVGVLVASLVHAGYISLPQPLGEFLGTAACSRPITYRIGTLDPRFGLSKEELEQDLKDAAELWNIAAGKTVLSYDVAGTVPVNLIYEGRQQIVELGKVISTEQQAYNQQKSNVDQMRASYLEFKEAHEDRVWAFDAKTDAYNKEVAYWNARGGAPEGEYQKLQRTQAELASEQVVLNQEVASLNTQVANLNAATAELNNLARATNSKVNAYNAEAGQEFDQGDYVSDAQGQRIFVYEFTDKINLKRVLAHELGHALGIGHVEGESSMMYEKNVGTMFKLSANDIAELKEVCKI